MMFCIRSRHWVDVSRSVPAARLQYHGSHADKAYLKSLEDTQILDNN